MCITIKLFVISPLTVEEERPKKEVKEDTKAKVKPRTVWEKPELYNITDDSCWLRWQPSSLPNYAEQTPIHYIVEKREPPNTDWIRLAGDVDDTTYHVGSFFLDLINIVFMFIYLSISLSLYIYMYVCVCVCVYVCMYVCMFVCICLSLYNMYKADIYSQSICKADIHII